MTISTKWPAARLRGPNVSPEHAREFIRRTDKALVGDGFSNNHHFEERLKDLLGLEKREGEEWSASYRRRDAYAKAFGHVSLEHLDSNWIACAWIGGPHGPVSQTGKVLLAKNIGKWPSTEEVEADLTAIATNFPWLAFDLSIWGHAEEGDEGLPSDTWRLEGGKWEAVEPRVLQVSEPDHMGAFFTNLNNPTREQTWSIEQIERMWGEQIASARAASVAEAA